MLQLSPRDTSRLEHSIMSSGGTLLDAGAGAGASQSTAMRDPLLGRPTSLGLGRDKILPLPTLFERVGRMVQDAVHGHNNQHRYDATGLRVARVLNSMWYKVHTQLAAWLHGAHAIARTHLRVDTVGCTRR